MYVEPTAEEVELLDLTFGGFDGNQNGHRSSVLQSRSMYVEPTAEETELLDLAFVVLVEQNR